MEGITGASRKSHFINSQLVYLENGRMCKRRKLSDQIMFIIPRTKIVPMARNRADYAFLRANA